jgi:hypothetical protein
MDYHDNLSGFVPADPMLFQCGEIVDLRDSSWCFCEFRFRGLPQEIEKFRQYLNENGLEDHIARKVSDMVGEVRVIAMEKTPDLIEKFPALKVTGLAEHWLRQGVYVMYSASGFSGITQMQFGGAFDRRHDSGDGRWEWKYDMMEPVSVRFTWLQTGEEERVSYRYPYTDDWNWPNYAREWNGRIYVPKRKPEDDFVIEDGVLRAYHGFGGDVVIPATVHKINEYCQVFSHNTTITSVIIPGSIQRIPGYTFDGCRNLRKVVLGEGVTCVEIGAFMDCMALTELVLPENLVQLMPNAFLRCAQLDVANLKLPAGLRCAGKAFCFCKNVPELLLNEDKTILLSCDIHDKPFELVIPDTVTEIGANALFMEKNLTSVRFSSGLRRIGRGAFKGCAALILKTLPDSLEVIADDAFRGCAGTDSLILPNSVKIVGRQALGMPVRKVRLSPGMKHVPEFAFVESSYAGTESSPNYCLDWKIPLQEAVVCEGTEVIDACGFVGCDSLTKITLPDTLKNIGNFAFAYCASLPRLELPAGLESIGKGAFLACKNLKGIEIPAGIQILEEEILRDCTGLREIHLSENARVIGKKAFRGCTALERITIADGLEEIGEGAFQKCAALSAVTLPQSLLKVGKEAFCDCVSLKTLTIPGRVQEIPLGMFQSCRALECIRIEPGVQKIAGRAFKDCIRLNKVEIPSTVTKIGAKVFAGCLNVTILCEKGSTAEQYAWENGLPVSVY